MCISFSRNASNSIKQAYAEVKRTPLKKENVSIFREDQDVVLHIGSCNLFWGCQHLMDFVGLHVPVYFGPSRRYTRNHAIAAHYCFAEVRSLAENDRLAKTLGSVGMLSSWLVLVAKSSAYVGELEKHIDETAAV